LPIYATAYVIFVAIEFSLYESLLGQIEERCNGKGIVDYSLENVRALQAAHSRLLQALNVAWGT